MSVINQMLRDLEQGDPLRPLSSARNSEVLQRLQAVEQTWLGTVRPLVVAYLGSTGAEREAIVTKLADTAALEALGQE